MLSAFYRQGETLGDAFARLYNHHFNDDGLILFDAENARCKKAVAPLLDRILQFSDSLNDTLISSTSAVQRGGYEPQIHPQANRLQLFLKEGNVRIPIDNEGAILYEDKPPKKVGIDALRKIAAQSPGDLLPKVSLRPIMQDYLFPTVAYCAGPSEIAYFAQLKPLYDHLEVRMPAIIPRLSMTLIEAKIGKILDKHQFTPEQLAKGPNDLINEVIESDPSNDIVALYAEARKKWDELNHLLTFGMVRIDPTLGHSVEKSMLRWQQGLNVLEEKARAALSQKNKTLVSQIHKCCKHLAPNGIFQERRYSLPYYYTRYGQSLFDSIHKQSQIDLHKHQLIVLE